MKNLAVALSALAALSPEERAALATLGMVLPAPAPTGAVEKAQAFMGTVQLKENERLDPVTGEIKRRPGRPRKNPVERSSSGNGYAAPAPEAKVETAPAVATGPMVAVKGWDHRRFTEHGATFDKAAKVWMVPAEHAAKLTALEAADEKARAERRTKMGAIGGRWDFKAKCWKVPARYFAEARAIVGEKARITAV